MTLFEVAQELARRLAGTFLRDGDGRRPVYGGTRLFQEDRTGVPSILFHEHFHGDNGAGLGASHQTGWTGLVARLIQSLAQFARQLGCGSDLWFAVGRVRLTPGRQDRASWPFDCCI